MMPRKKVKSKNGGAMPMVHPNAAAIDVGSTLLMAAVRPDRTSEPVRSFGTFTTDLHRLAASFAECGVETVAMESTSVYWVPIYELLDARGFTCSLSMHATPSTCPGARPTSAMHNGCSGFILTVCCAPAFAPKVISSRYAPTYVSASVCSSMRPRIFSTCRRR